MLVFESISGSQIAKPLRDPASQFLKYLLLRKSTATGFKAQAQELAMILDSLEDLDVSNQALVLALFPDRPKVIAPVVKYLRREVLKYASARHVLLGRGHYMTEALIGCGKNCLRSRSFV